MIYNQLPGMGKDKWIKYRLNRNFTNPFPTNEMEVYLRPIGPSNIVPWPVAVKNVAEDIHANYKNLYVSMSGGIDSESVAKAFYENNIPFKPIIFEVSDLLELDTWWAYKWCKERNIEPVVITAPLDEWMKRIISVSKRYCGRFGQGNATMEYLYDYVIANNGNLVTGGGFIEYFPDENIDYMYKRYQDSALHDSDGNMKQGYIFHEPDIIQAIGYPEMPFNFLSWTPEIVLSYIYHRDMTLDSAANKAKIMGCLPRPKNMGAPGVFFRERYLMRKWLAIRNNIGNSECAFLGSKEEIMNILINGVGSE